MIKKYLLSLVCASLLMGTNVKAQENVISANLSTMFDEKKANEYSFNKKYKGKRLIFGAKIDMVDSACYQQLKGSIDNTIDVPCIKLNPIDKELLLWGILPTSIANAEMRIEDDYGKVSKGQYIKLNCKLSDKEIAFDFTDFHFIDCIFNK